MLSSMLCNFSKGGYDACSNPMAGLEKVHDGRSQTPLKMRHLSCGTVRNVCSIGRSTNVVLKK